MEAMATTASVVQIDALMTADEPMQFTLRMRTCQDYAMKVLFDFGGKSRFIMQVRLCMSKTCL